MVKARQRRRAQLVATLIAFGPGGVGTILFGRSVLWVSAVSWVTWWATHLAAWAAETPVEEEN